MDARTYDVVITFTMIPIVPSGCLPKEYESTLSPIPLVLLKITKSFPETGKTAKFKCAEKV
jgi:hypothetical protein